MVITFGGEKGGPGKSALTLNMGVCALVRGHSVMIVDGDKQRTSAKFCERRSVLNRADASAGFTPLLCAEKRGDMLDLLDDYAGKYDFVFVDVAGAETPQLISAVRGSDRLYTPMVPSECDLDTAESMSHVVDMVRAGGNRDLQAWTVINRITYNAQARSHELEYARDVLESYPNLPLAETVITERSIVRKAYTARRGVVEFAASPIAKVRKAAAATVVELWALYGEITGDVQPEAAINEVANG